MKSEDFKEKSVSFFLIAVFLFFPISMALGYIAMALVLLFWLSSGKVKFYWSFIGSKIIVWVVLGLYAVMLFGILYTDANSADIFIHLSKYSKLLLIPAFIALLADDRLRHRCMSAYALAMLLILASVYANIWWDLPWSKTHNQGWSADHTVIGDYITQGIMMTFFVVVALDRGLRENKTGRRIAWFAVSGLAAISIVYLSKGRTGYLLLAAALFVFAVFSVSGFRRWVVLSALAVAGFIIISTAENLQQRIESAVTEIHTSDRMEITSIGGRINFWKNTLRLIEERPLVGWGTGSYHDQWCKAVTEPGWCEFGRWHPHNQFLFFWMEHGLAGLLLFVAMVLAPVVAAYQAMPRERRLVLSFAAIFVIDSLINASLWSSRESHFFVVMLAWVLAQAWSAPAKPSTTKGAL